MGYDRHVMGYYTGIYWIMRMDNDNGMVCDSVNTIINQPVTNHDLGYLGVISGVRHY